MAKGEFLFADLASRFSKKVDEFHTGLPSPFRALRISSQEADEIMLENLASTRAIKSARQSTNFVSLVGSSIIS